MTAAPIAQPGEFAAAVDELRAALTRVSAAPLWQVADAELAGLLASMEAAGRTVAAEVLRLVSEAESRGTPESVGATSTGAWVGQVTGTSPAAGAALARFAQHLSDFPVLFAAMDAGCAPAEHVRVALRALREIGPRVDDTTLRAAEQQLAHDAGRFSLPEFRAVVATLVAAADPDGPEPPDPEAQARRRSLRVSDATVDGLHRLTGWLTDEDSAVVLTALSPLAAPRNDNGRRDPRPPERRLAEALVELCGHALDHGDDLPEQGGVRPHVTVTIGLGELEGRLKGVGLLDFGGPITPEVARRLSCDAEIVPVVLGGAGVPLDVGRASRTPSSGMRRAVVARDGGCAFGGCSRPAAWSEVHHVRHWAQGGTTSLDNMVLLCRRHHEEVHSGGWEVRIGGDGRAEFRPPPWTLQGSDWRPGRRHPLTPGG